MSDEVVGTESAGTETTAVAAAPSSGEASSVATNIPVDQNFKYSKEGGQAREILDNAKKGIFPKAKEAKKAEKVEAKSETVDTKVEDKAPKTAGVEIPPTTPTYTPNFKYRVAEKELEFDELIKPLIKDEATEKKIRQLYADASGLGHLKNQYGEVSKKHREVSEKYENLDKDLRLLSHHVQNSDFDNFFKDLQIPEEKIFSWVQKKLSELEMPPEQRAELDRVRSAQREAFLLREENQSYKQQWDQQQVQARTYELDTELMKPEVSQIVQDFDARVGKVGAFREEVIHRGALAWHYGKRDIPPAEAIQQVISLMGRTVVPPSNAVIQPPANGVSQQNTAAAPHNPPVIPNVTGRSTSPVRAVPRSVAELRQMQKQFARS